MTDWPGYFLSPAIIVHFYITNKKFNLFALSLLAINLSAALIFLGHIFMLTGLDGISHMFDQFLFRSGLSSFVENTNIISSITFIGISLFDFIFLHIYRSMLYFTIGIVILSSLWVIYFLKNRAGKDGIIWCIFLMSLLNVCIFGNASVYHDFWNFYFTYFFALSASFGVLILWLSGSNNKKRIAVVLIFLFIIQSFWLLNRRHTQNEGYPLDIPLAMSLKENVNPDTYACSSLKIFPQFANFYADVSITPNIKTKESFLSCERDAIYKYFITATPRKIQSNIEFYSTFTLESLEKLGTLSDSSDLLLYLKKNYPYMEVNGFLLFTLK
jgi:hypothetical protein